MSDMGEGTAPAGSGPEGEAPTATLEPPDGTGAARVGSRWRRVLVIVLAVLTCVSILASTVGVWAHRTLLNTDSWVNAVGPLASNPDITDAVAKKLTDELMQMIDSSELAQNALPAQAQVLVAPLSEAVGQFVQRAVGELMQTQQFQDFWVQANRRVHALVVKVLRGDTDKVLTANGTVQLNLLPLIADAFRFVQSKAPGLFGNGTTVPDITFDTPVDQARDELQSSVKRTLPDDFGVITVFQSDKLKAAQDAVTLFDRVVIALLVVTVLLIAATIALAVNRRRTIIGLALGAVAAFAIAVAILKTIKAQVLDLIGDPTTRTAAGKTISTLVVRLDWIVYALVAIGLAVALIAFLTGSSRLAVRIRGGAAHVGGYLIGRGDDRGAPELVAWVQDNARALRWAGIVLGGLALAFVVHGWWSLFFTVLVVGLFEAAVAFAVARRATEPDVTSTASS
ncbi:MAG: hypothetical protein ACXWCM_08455 [Acidimicrobiales bacterium]